MFSVSSSGKSIYTANGPDSLLSMSAPFTKLDVTNVVSFQTISILFSNEPTQPTTTTTITKTLLHQFAHGYTYIPATWMQWQSPNSNYPTFPPPVGSNITTFYDFGNEDAYVDVLGDATGVSLYAKTQYNDNGGYFSTTVAVLYCEVDATNVSIYLSKISQVFHPDGSVLPIYIAGSTVNIRFYVFTEPATTSTY